MLDEEGVRISQKISKEYYSMLKAISSSIYFTPNPSDACLFIPSIDLLNQNKVHSKDIGKILSTLPHWDGGRNHLIFNIVPGSMPNFYPFPEVDVGSAIVTSGGFSSLTYRQGFDISVPVFSPLINTMKKLSKAAVKSWLVISSQIDIHEEFVGRIADLAIEHPNFLVLHNCDSQVKNPRIRCRDNQMYNYPDILQNGTFCLIMRGARLGHPVLTESLAAGCIPVIVADYYILPYSEVIDWRRASIQLYEDDLGKMMDVLSSVSSYRIRELRTSGEWIYFHYFSSVENIALTTLRIINDRVFPHRGRTFSDWNDVQDERSLLSRSTFALPIGPPRSQGFTAVLLTYNRLESLNRVLERISRAPSLAKIVVIWNNQQMDPPATVSWPRLSKPLQVVRTDRNLLSNRFYPYPEIETEAILAMDDDIIMLTTDELEFGFEVWRQFPDRIVGFPSRTHVWDRYHRSWKYESEWTNNISMVLTGAAFYHRIYNYYYSSAMPGDIKNWVDDHMNCEDIAMNFLVANLTGKAPIKVAPRKKFKCPECSAHFTSCNLLMSSNVIRLSAIVVAIILNIKTINRFAD
nr:EOG090X01LY [Macrothrix elegans]